MPSTLSFGPDLETICKLVGSVQSTCAFFSSFSILLIAVDRYIFIVHPTARQITPNKAVLFSCLGLLMSAAMSSPLFIFAKLDVRQNILTETVNSFCYVVRNSYLVIGYWELRWKAHLRKGGGGWGLDNVLKNHP